VALKDDKADAKSAKHGAGRNYARVTLDAFVRISSDEHDREYVFRTRDLSPTGLFLYTRVGHLYPIQVDSTLQVELHDFDHAVSFKALVVRVTDEGSTESEHYPIGFGLRIVEISKEHETRLTELIRRAGKGDLY
jgi:hypothetical protein